MPRSWTGCSPSSSAARKPATSTRLSPAWLLTAALALGRAAEDEVKAGRMTVEEASDVVRRS